MATGERILLKDLVEPGKPFQEATDSLKAYDEWVKKLTEDMKKMNATMGGQAIKKHTQAQKESIPVMEELQKLKKQELKLRAQTSDAANENREEIQQNILALKEHQKAQRLNNLERISATGSYAQVSAQMSKLSNQIRQLGTVEEADKKKRRELIKQYKEQNNELKRLDKEMGNHQRNVGNYGSAIKGLLPMMGVGLGLAGAFKMLQGVIKSTQDSGDAFNRFLGGANEGMVFLRQRLASLDFTNLISGFRDAWKAGKEYADMLDLIGDLERSLQIERGGIDVEIAQQRVIARNRRLDLSEREAAVDKIVELEKKKLEATK
jgi:Fe2+ transport system protein B